MDNPVNHGKLTTEQKLRLEILKRDIDKLTLPQAKEYLLESFRQMFVKDNIFKQLIKKI